ncbi:sensor histidine kinase [Streptomyces sp. BE147]|uniref:sensor histidine kinase n=1 Tax=unclassified Streptomyces TaxID=2593676 RepID=UPI002E7A7584|nr:sensor histidine kinase [Streptomyces sp. BE147]MEE1740532.1 sensor histidine kinase [Streptomyces sp. BE147]
MITDWRQPALRHPRTADAALALALFGLTFLVGSFDGAGQRTGSGGSPYVPVVLLGAVSSAALMWHRSHPRTVTVVTALCSAALASLGFALTVFTSGPVVVALYSLAVRTDRRTSRTFTLAAILVLLPLTMAFGPGTVFVVDQIGLIAWALLPGAVGDAVRTRRDYVAAVEARAELAERTREDEARRRVGEERIRIARDLHDVVAHHIALANAQAGTASYLMRADPGRAQQVMDHLAETTSSALRELKATVGLLRQSGDAEAPLDPAPGLGRLPSLVDSFGRSGLVVSVVTEGEERPLSPGVDLTAYRIVQEALTNVSKHAGTSAATVRLTYTHDRLALSVTDRGRPPRTPGAASEPGYGLIGMRERAASVGGLLLAGRRAEGGFEVTTELPLRTGQATGSTAADGRADSGTSAGAGSDARRGEESEGTAP